MSRSKPMGGVMRIDAEGYVSFVGMDIGTRHAVVAAQNKHAIVIHVPGFLAWNGNYCPRQYVPATTRVYQIVERLADGSLRVEGLIEWDKRRSKQ